MQPGATAIPGCVHPFILHPMQEIFYQLTRAKAKEVYGCETLVAPI